MTNISERPTDITSNDLTATITASGFPGDSTSRWRIGIGRFARIGAGTAATIL